MSIRLVLAIVCAILPATVVPAAAATPGSGTVALPPGFRIVTSSIQATRADGSVTFTNSASVVAGASAKGQTGFLEPAASASGCDEDGGILVPICTTLNYSYFTGSGCPSGLRCVTLVSRAFQFSLTSWIPD